MSDQRSPDIGRGAIEDKETTARPVTIAASTAATPAPLPAEHGTRTAGEDAKAAAKATEAVRAALAEESGADTKADNEPRLPDEVVTWKENMLRGKYKDWGYPGALPYDKFDEIDRRLTDKFPTVAEIGDSALQTELREIVNELKNNPEYNGSILTLDNPSQISQLLDRFPQAYDDKDKEEVLEDARQLAEEGKIQFPDGFHFDVVFAQEDPDGPRAGEITMAIITLQPGAPEPHPLPSYYFEEQGHDREEAQRLADEFNAKQHAEEGAGEPPPPAPEEGTTTDQPATGTTEAGAGGGGPSGPTPEPAPTGETGPPALQAASAAGGDQPPKPPKPPGRGDDGGGEPPVAEQSPTEPAPPEPAPVATATGTDQDQPKHTGKRDEEPPSPAPIERSRGGEPAEPGVAPVTRAEEPPAPPEHPREDLRADQVTGLSMASAKQRIGGDTREEKEVIQKEIELLAQERREQSRDDIPSFLRHPIRYWRAHGFRTNTRENYMDARLTQYHEQQAREILAGLGMQMSGLPREFQRQLREAAQQALVAEADERGLKGRKRKRWLKGKTREQRKIRKAENKQRKAEGRERDSYMFAATREQHAIDRQELRIVRALRESAFLSQDEINSRPDNDDVKRFFGDHGSHRSLRDMYITVLKGDFEATQTLAARASQQLGPDAIRATIGEKMGTASISEGMEQYLKEKVLQPFIAEALRSGGTITDEMRLKFRNNAQGIFFTREFANWQQQMEAKGNKSLDLSLSYGMDGLEQYAEQAVTKLKEYYRGHEQALQKLDVFMQSVTFAEVSVGTLKAGESVDIEKNWWQKKISRAITARQVHEMYRQIRSGELSDLEERFAPAAYDAALERTRFLAKVSGKGIIGPGSMTLAVLTGVGIGTSQGLLRWGGSVGAGAAIGSVALLGTPLAPTILAAAAVAGGVKYFQERRRARRETSQVAIQTARGATAPDNAPRRQAIEKRLFKGRNAGEVITSLTAHRDTLRELSGRPIPEAVLTNLLVNLADMQARDRLAAAPPRGILWYKRGPLSEMYNATGGERDTMMIRRAEVLALLRPILAANPAPLQDLQRRMGITGDLDSTIGTLATHIERNLDTGQRIDTSLRSVLGEGIKSSESMKTRERVLRRYRQWRGIKMGTITSGSVLIGSQTVGRGISFAVSHVSNFIGIGSAGSGVARAIENGAKRGGATPEATYQEFLNQNPAPEGTQWVPNPEKPNSFDLVFKDQRLDNVGENPVLRPLINDLHQTSDGVWAYDVAGSDVQPDQFGDFVKGQLAEGLTTSPVEALSIPQQQEVLQLIEDQVRSIYPDGVDFQPSADGNGIDIINTENGGVIIDNLRFDDQGGITWDANAANPETIEQFTAIYDQLAEQMAANKTESVSVADIWREHQTSIAGTEWYSNDTVGSDGNELRLHTVKTGDGTFALQSNTMGISTAQSINPSTIDVAALQDRGLAAYEFVTPGNDTTPLIVYADTDGNLNLDVNSHDPNDLIYFANEKTGLPDPNNTMTRGDFSRMLLNQQMLNDLPQGDVATEVYGRQNLFNLGGDGGGQGRISAGTLGFDENGKLTFRSFATIFGTNNTPQTIDITIPGQELPPLHPPAPLPTELTTGQPDGGLSPFPILIPITRRPLEKVRRRGEQSRNETRTGAPFPLGPGPERPPAQRQPWKPNPQDLAQPKEGTPRYNQNDPIAVPPGTKVNGRDVSTIQFTDQGVTITFREGKPLHIPHTFQDPNFPNITHTIQDTFLNENGEWYITTRGSDENQIRTYPLGFISRELQQPSTQSQTSQPIQLDYQPLPPGTTWDDLQSGRVRIEGQPTQGTPLQILNPPQNNAVTNYTAYVSQYVEVPGQGFRAVYKNPAEVRKELGRRPTDRDKQLLRAGFSLEDVRMIDASQNARGRTPEQRQEEVNYFVGHASQPGVGVLAEMNNFDAYLRRERDEGRLTQEQYNSIWAARTTPPPSRPKDKTTITTDETQSTRRVPKIVDRYIARREAKREQRAESDYPEGWQVSLGYKKNVLIKNLSYEGEVVNAMNLSESEQSGFLKLIMTDGTERLTSLRRRDPKYPAVIHNMQGVFVDKNGRYRVKAEDNHDRITTPYLSEFLTWATPSPPNKSNRGIPVRGTSIIDVPRDEAFLIQPEDDIRYSDGTAFRPVGGIYTGNGQLELRFTDGTLPRRLADSLVFIINGHEYRFINRYSRVKNQDDENTDVYAIFNSVHGDPPISIELQNFINGISSGTYIPVIASQVLLSSPTATEGLQPMSSEAGTAAQTELSRTNETANTVEAVYDRYHIDTSEHLAPLDEAHEQEFFDRLLDASTTSYYTHGPHGFDNYRSAPDQGQKLADLGPWGDRKGFGSSRLTTESPPIIEAVHYGPAKTVRVRSYQRTVAETDFFQRLLGRKTRTKTEYTRVLENRETPPGQEPLYTVSYTFNSKLANIRASSIPDGTPYWGTPHDNRPGAYIELDWTLPASQARELLERAIADPEFMRRFVNATAHRIGPEAFGVDQQTFDEWWERRARNGASQKTGYQPPWDEWPADRMNFFEELPQTPAGNPEAIDRDPPITYPGASAPHYTFDNTHRRIRPQTALSTRPSAARPAETNPAAPRAGGTPSGRPLGELW